LRMKKPFNNPAGDFLWAAGIEDTFVPQARPVIARSMNTS